MPPDRSYRESTPRGNEHLPMKPNEALILEENACQCGNCGMPIDLAERLKQCPRVTCRKIWKYIVADTESTPQMAIDAYLPVISLGAPEEAQKPTSPEQPSRKQWLGRRSVERVRLNNDFL